MSTTPPPTNDMNVYILQPTGMFRNAPFCKFWFITTIICSIIKMYMNLQTSQRNTTVLAEIDAYSVLHMIFSTFTAVSIPELTVTSLCIYFLRNIERRFGTRRFMNVLFISLLLSHGIHISILKFLFIHYDPGKIFFYYSPLTAIFIAYFNYILEVPVFATSMIFDLLPASDHHFILILLSQTITKTTIIHYFIPALIATIIMKMNFCMIQKLQLFPKFLSPNHDSFIGLWLKTFEEFAEAKKGRNLPIAATLERQKIEEDDEIHRQLFQRQTRNIARNFVQPPEFLIRNLMDMGFNDRNQVIRALQDVGNDVEMAANLLIQRNFND